MSWPYNYQDEEDERREVLGNTRFEDIVRQLHGQEIGSANAKRAVDIVCQDPEVRELRQERIDSWVDVASSQGGLTNQQVEDAAQDIGLEDLTAVLGRSGIGFNLAPGREGGTTLGIQSLDEEEDPEQDAC